MKEIIKLIIVVFIVSQGSLYAQDNIYVEAMSEELSLNLDLDAVASLFGEAENLDDFEKKLNDPGSRISNIDLNQDGEVDYLRVVEVSKGETRLVTIQAVIGKDQFQDVAIIDIEKNSEGEVQVQVVGDVYLYGPNFIIQPIYVHRPVIFLWFFGVHYRPWRSPYYWRYYPPYFIPWRPYPIPKYRGRVGIHVNVKNSYRRATIRRSKVAVTLHKGVRRNDYGVKNPDKSFVKRNENIGKIQENSNNIGSKNAVKSSGKKVQNWKPKSTKTGGKRNVKGNRGSESLKNKQTIKRTIKGTSKPLKKKRKPKKK